MRAMTFRVLDLIDTVRKFMVLGLSIRLLIGVPVPALELFLCMRHDVRDVLSCVVGVVA